MRKDAWKASLSVAPVVGVSSEDRHLPFLLLPLLATEEITPLLPTCSVCVSLMCLLSGLTIRYWKTVFLGKSIAPTLLSVL